jgi:hypothetical protein
MWRRRSSKFTYTFLNKTRSLQWLYFVRKVRPPWQFITQITTPLSTKYERTTAIQTRVGWAQHPELKPPSQRLVLKKRWDQQGKFWRAWGGSAHWMTVGCYQLFLSHMTARTFMNDKLCIYFFYCVFHASFCFWLSPVQSLPDLLGVSTVAETWRVRIFMHWFNMGV